MHNNGPDDIPRSFNRQGRFGSNTENSFRHAETFWDRCCYMLGRLKSDFRLAIVSFFAVCSISTVTPFGVYRFMSGDFIMAFVDLAIVCLFVALVVYAWRSGRSILAGTLTAAIATLAALFAVLAMGLSPYWIFGSLTANFLMAERRFALIAGAALIAFPAMQAGVFESDYMRMSFIAVAIMMSLFNLIFAARVDSQHQQLNNMASRDPLTGALNRRAMNLDLAAVIERYRANSCAMGVAMIDLDNFKRLNDQFGHEAGDRVLVELVAIINRHVRSGDHFYRFGGEEFVLLLPGADGRGLRVALNNLREALQKELRGPDGPVTVSIGGAVLERDEDWPDWLSRADEALLNAKRAGRDRVRISRATHLAPQDPQAKSISA